MNAKEISDATLPAVTPADNDLMLIYDTSEGTTGKATIEDIAPKVAENIRITQIILKDSDYIYINPGSLNIFKYGRIVFVISAMLLDASSWDSLTLKVFAKNLPPPIGQCRNIMSMQLNTGRIMGFSLNTNGELRTEQTIAFSKDEISGYWPFSFCYLTNS